MSVSDNDIMSVSGNDYITVSTGDITSPTDITPIMDGLDNCNYLLGAILFFAVFRYCEEKIVSGVRRLMKNE